jgi:hypothetical protein
MRCFQSYINPHYTPASQAAQEQLSFSKTQVGMICIVQVSHSCASVHKTPGAACRFFEVKISQEKEGFQIENDVQLISKEVISVRSLEEFNVSKNNTHWKFGA